MEQAQKDTRKLVAFGAVVLLCAGAPHFLLDRGFSWPQYGTSTAHPAPGNLYPSSIGEFQLVNRWQRDLVRNVVEVGATYRDATSTRTAQFDTQLNAGFHNGAECYIARGMQLEWRRAELMTTADSTVTFEIISIVDESISGAGRSSVLIASAECMRDGCKARPLKIRTGPELALLNSHPVKANASDQPGHVSFSIIFQTSGNSGNNKQDEEEALMELRKLVAGFSLGPLRQLAADN